MISLPWYCYGLAAFYRDRTKHLKWMRTAAWFLHTEVGLLNQDYCRPTTNILVPRTLSKMTVFSSLNLKDNQQ